MIFETSFGAWFNASSGLVLAIIGLAVLTRNPRHRLNQFFAMFMVGVGLALLPNNLFGANTPVTLRAAVRPLSAIAWSVAAVGVVGLAFRLPYGRPDSDQRLTRILAALFVAMMATILGWLQFQIARGDFRWGFNIFYALAFPFFQIAFGVTIAAWGARAHRLSAKAGDKAGRDLAFVALGGAPFAGMALLANGIQALDVGPRQPTAYAYGLIALGIPLLVAATWIHVAVTRPRLRALAIAVPILFVLPWWLHEYVVTGDSRLSADWGIWRLIGGAIIGYGIVRYQVFNIELRLKWSINRGTIAAVFAGVFAIVGLAASEFLVDEYGYIAGAFAAGLLLFALEPLKRFGANVAERALPNVHDDAEYRAGRGRDIYRAALQGMMADGKLSDKEQDVLAKLADDLGLAVQDVRAIQKELS